MPNLLSLELHGNGLSGELPSEMYDASKIQLLNVAMQYQYAFQCRFGFKNVIEKAPSLQKAKDLLLDTIVLHFKFEVKQGQLNTAKRILKELQERTQDTTILAPLIAEVKKEEERRQRSSELSTQIQYKLLEQLQQLKKKQ